MTINNQPGKCHAFAFKNESENFAFLSRKDVILRTANDTFSLNFFRSNYRYAGVCNNVDNDTTHQF